MDQDTFNQTLHNFAVDFGYGGAIRHLVDRGYDTDRIIRDFDYPLSRETIDRIVKQHLEKKTKGEK